MPPWVSRQSSVQRSFLYSEVSLFIYDITPRDSRDPILLSRQQPQHLEHYLVLNRCPEIFVEGSSWENKLQR